MISTMTATRTFNAIRPIINMNATKIYVYRLRNYKGLENSVKVANTVYHEKTLLALHSAATESSLAFCT